VRKQHVIRIVRPLCTAALLLILPCYAYGQDKKQSDDGQLLPALLDEVRLLRQTLQKANLHAYRGQILVERIRVQQDRVARSANTLEDVQNEIRELETQAPQLEDRLKELNERVERVSDAKERAELEDEVKTVKQTQSLQRQRADDLRRREAQLSEVVRSEQDKLADLERRLDALEEELERSLKGIRVTAFSRNF
jgi:predicted  nucleic acid-binding Zn-ribbon protein